MCKAEIRARPANPSYSVDSLIEHIVKQSSDPADYAAWRLRQDSHRQWAELKKQLGSCSPCRVKDVEPGAKLDVRDREYIWCVGMVKLKIAVPSDPASLMIHYEVVASFHNLGLE